MTISYTLYLASDAAPRDAAGILRRVIGEATPAPLERTPKEIAWLADGSATISAQRLDFLPALAEENGVAAKLAVHFDLVAEKVVEAKPVMLRDLLALLDRLPGDAVFHDVADKIVLRRRRGGKIELNLSCPFWTPELRALVSAPHTNYGRP